MLPSSTAMTMTVLLVAGSAIPVNAQCASWSRDSTGGQNGRWNHAMVYDSLRQRPVMYGGENPGMLSEMFWWNGAAWVPIDFDDGPSFRTGHSMAYDIARDRIVLFGGRNDANLNTLGGDTWEFDGTSWAQVATTGPQPRRNAAMIYDSARHKCVLFGGGLFPATTSFGDTWEWDGVAWQSVTASAGSPGANAYPSMAYDSTRHVAVLTDGRSVWEYGGAQWQLVNDQGPFVRYENAISYDSVRHKIVVYGGSLTPTYAAGYPDVRTWDGNQWTLETACGPGPRWAAAMVFDESRGRHIVYGGVDAVTAIQPASTWSWNGTGGPVTPVIVVRPSDVTVNEDHPVNLSALALSSDPVSYQWRHDGVAVSNGPGGASVGGGTVEGADTPNLHILLAWPTDGGMYDVVASNALGQAISTAARVTVFPTPPPPPPPPDHCSRPECYPNCDHNTTFPCLSANDFQCFLNAFAQGCTGDPLACYANCDRSQTVPVLTANDFACYLNWYAAGCQ